MDRVRRGVRGSVFRVTPSSILRAARIRNAVKALPTGTLAMPAIILRSFLLTEEGHEKEKKERLFKYGPGGGVLPEKIG